MFTPNPDFDAMFDAGLVIWDNNDIPVRTRIAVDVTRTTTVTVADLDRAAA